MSEHVRPDEFFRLNLPSGEAYLVNAKYDRIDYFTYLGSYVLKAYDDDDGLVTLHLDEQTAMAIKDATELPMVSRDWMYQTEYEGYLEAQAQKFNDQMFGGFDETPDPPEEQTE